MMPSYVRSSDGKFAGSAGARASTKKTSRTASRLKKSRGLVGKHENKKSRGQSGLAKKARGQRVTTRVAKRAADAARKRFG